jgi:Flp pilus assembly protein TadD
MGSRTRWAAVGTLGLGALGLISHLANLSTVSGFSFRDLPKFWNSASSPTLSKEARSALRLRLRKLAADGSLSVEDSQELRDYAAGLKLEAQPAESYLAEVEPQVLQAAKELQEGAELVAQQRLPEARSRFREAVRLDGENVTAWANFGGAALELGNTAEAETALRKALALEPGSIEANYNFGACLAAQNRSAAAFDHLERSLSLLLRSEAPPVFERQALLDDLQKSPHFSSLRTSARFDALIRRVQDDFR